MSRGRNRIEAMLFLRRLADLTSGGMTLHRSITILRSHSKGGSIQILLRSVQEQLESGQSLSTALASHSGFVAPLYIGLIRAGESTGNLESTLEESARLLENEMETAQRIRTALAYPAFLLLVATAVCIFLTAFVIPRFEFLFQDLGQRLPLPTRSLIVFSAAVTHFGWVFLLLGGIVFTWGQNTKVAWKSKTQKLLLQIPGFSDVIKGTFLQRWAHVMASLLKSGFTVADALALSVQTLAGFGVSNELTSALQRLQEGHSLKAALEPSPLFPPLVCELIGSGEESGRLEDSFFRIADSAKRETELRSKLLLSLLEPALITGMGVVVGFVAIAMLLPIFEMSASFR